MSNLMSIVDSWSDGSGAKYYTATTTPNATITPYVTTTYVTSGNSGIYDVGTVVQRDSSEVSRLTSSQVDQLMHGHEFIDMDGNDWCLFCYALGQKNTRLDHIFVISEE